ncbi:MAG: LysR family transcriptional regulator [Burkholderiaceae bacterium]
MNTDHIDLDLLRHLIALAEEKSVSRAAKRQGLSQPAMSHALARLRQTFGDPLFVRLGGSLEPTVRAQELYPEALRIIDNVRRMLQSRAAFDPSTASGDILITAAEHVAHRLGPRLAGALASQAPGMRLELRRSTPEIEDRSLEKGEVDLRLGWMHEPGPAVRSKFLYSEQVTCLVRRDHPAVRNRISISEFVRLGHVRARHSSGSWASRFIDDAMRRRNKTLKITMIVPSHLTIGCIVAGSDLLATLPVSIARTLADQLPLAMIAPPFEIPARRVCMYWHERAHRDPRQLWLRQTIMRVSQEAASDA